MDMELLDAWILTDPNSPYPQTPVPNTVCFEVERVLINGCVQKVYTVTQFCSNKSMYKPDSTATPPVCVVRSTNVKEVRGWWQMFVDNDWVRVSPATPVECDNAIIAVQAKAYRSLIVNKTAKLDEVVYTGEYHFVNAGIESDFEHSLYFRKRFLIDREVMDQEEMEMMFHPVTGMPMHRFVHEFVRKPHTNKVHT